MIMREQTIPIPGRLKNVAIGGHVAGSEDIDAGEGKTQKQVNDETNDTLALHQSEISGLNSQNYVSVSSYSSLPATGSANTIYRVSSWDGNANSGEGAADVTKYTEYAWNGTAYIVVSVKTQIGEVFDISEYKAVGGTLATFENLSAALDSGNNVPVGVRKGGMSIKYVQSSDNKYVQARCMAQNFTTDVTQWQGVDDEPIEDSNNLIKSCAVAIIRDLLIGDNYTDVELTSNTGYVRANGTITSASIGFYTNPISVSKNTAVIISTSSINVFSAVSEYNNGVYTPIYLGKSSNEGIPSTYTLVANRDMQIVISGYSYYFSKTTCKLLNFTNYTALKNITDYISGLTTAISSNKMPDGYVTSATGVFADVHTFPINKFYQVINSSVASNIDNKPNGVTTFGVYTLSPSDEGNVMLQILTDKNKNTYISAYYAVNGWGNWLKIGDSDTFLELIAAINNQITEIVGTATVPTIKTQQEGKFVRYSNGTIGSSGGYIITSPIQLLKGQTLKVRATAADIVAVIALTDAESTSYTPAIKGIGDGVYEYIATEDCYAAISYSGGDTFGVQILSDGTIVKTAMAFFEAEKQRAENAEMALHNELTDVLVNNIITAFDNIVCVGDSLTYSQVYTAQGHSRQAYNPWPKIIKKICGLDEYAIYARSGGTSKSIWNYYKDEFNVPANGKTLCFIYLGTNNWFEDTLDTSAPAADVDTYETSWADDYTGSMCKVIQKFINLGAKICIIRPHDGGIYPTDEVPAGWTLEDTNAVLLKIINRFNCAYVDSANMFSNDAKYHYYPDLSGANGLHFNDLGYAFFASCLIKQTGIMDTEYMKRIIPI